MFLTASDKTKIAATWYEVEKPKKHLILAHMMPATKESWSDFASEAVTRGYSSVAIDLRGHGKSFGGPNGYKAFIDAEHQKGILDIDAAVKFLLKNGVKPSEIVFVGASIGANLVLQYITENPEYEAAALLSAGTNYHGVDALSAVKKLSSGQRVIFVTSRDDERSGGNNAAMNYALYQTTPDNVFKKLVIYDRGGHGTDMFQTTETPDLVETLFTFLDLDADPQSVAAKRLHNLVKTEERLKSLARWIEEVGGGFSVDN